MPTTPTYALPYPAPADPADVPLDLSKLAQAVEAIGPLSYWILSGGTTLISNKPGGVFSQPPSNGSGFVYNPGAAGGSALYCAVQGEAQPRFYAQVDGFMRFGPGGSTAPDTSLYRSAAGVLSTGGEFQATGRLNTSSYIVVQTGGATQSVFGDVSNWLGGASRPGVVFGNGFDTNLYRSAAGQLKTDGYFFAGQSVYSWHGAAPQVVIGSDSGLSTGNASILFGSTSDTKLYRSQANRLQTDGDLKIRGAAGSNAGIFLGDTGGNAPMIVFQPGANQVTLNYWSANTFQISGGIITNGNVYLGQGSNYTDTYLYRASAAQVGSGGSFYAQTFIQAAGDLYAGTSQFWVKTQAGGACVVRVGSIESGSGFGDTAGQRGLVVGDTSSYPPGNPVNGGVLFSINGQLQWKSSTGKITALTAG